MAVRRGKKMNFYYLENPSCYLELGTVFCIEEDPKTRYAVCEKAGTEKCETDCDLVDICDSDPRRIPFCSRVTREDHTEVIFKKYNENRQLQ